MQLLAKDSVEKGHTQGLGWIDARVIPIDKGPNKRVPHVGWNNVLIEKKDSMFERIETNADFFFDHSFHMLCPDALVTGSCVYGKKMVASIQKKNIFATQFHPEKSQRNGLKFLRNFADFVFSDRSFKQKCLKHDL
jgi:glutamine amidotransferase